MKKLLSAFLVLMMVFGSAAYAEGGASGVEDGVLTVAMECAYAPYNWAQPDDSNGAVPIKGTSLYANGYDVMTAKAICEANGWQLEVMQLDWDSLIPAVQSGICDAVIAGQVIDTLGIGKLAVLFGKANDGGIEIRSGEINGFHPF